MLDMLSLLQQVGAVASPEQSEKASPPSPPQVETIPQFARRNLAHSRNRLRLERLDECSRFARPVEQALGD
jgi:hypothetical protein